MLKFSRNLGVRNNPENLIRWSSTVKPALGGIGFYIIFLLSAAFYTTVFNSNSINTNPQLLGFLAATSIAFIMGLADDAYNTKPLLKLFVQFFCGLILIATGTHIELFGDNLIDYPLTILWVVGIMNSINMLDNMDGITTIVSVFIISFALISEYLSGSFYNIYIIILIGVLAALIAFLYYNWYPSKMFMGDTGSQFLGIVLASIGIVCCLNTPDHFGQKIQTKQILTLLFVFIIPICDTMIVVVNRISQGKSPFVGGRDHTTHHLFFNGITERKIGVLFGAITLLSITLALLIRYTASWNFLHIGFFSLYFLSVLSVLFYITRRKKQ
jgi:UDP-GlcNAc:undecaprenyl-phosphate GlcNAc-1-phosphate transferase